MELTFVFGYYCLKCCFYLMLFLYALFHLRSEVSFCSFQRFLSRLEIHQVLYGKKEHNPICVTMYRLSLYRVYSRLVI